MVVVGVSASCRVATEPELRWWQQACPTQAGEWPANSCARIAVIVEAGDLPFTDHHLYEIHVRDLAEGAVSGVPRQAELGHQVVQFVEVGTAHRVPRTVAAEVTVRVYEWTGIQAARRLVAEYRVPATLTYAAAGEHPALPEVRVVLELATQQ